VWPAADCEGTAHARAYRTWFHFSVACAVPVEGASATRTVRLVIRGCSKQGALYKAGHRPAVIGGLGTPKGSRKWARGRSNVESLAEGDESGWRLAFSHTWPKVASEDGATTTQEDGTLCRWVEYAFGFCFPFGYADLLRMGDALEQSLGNDALGEDRPGPWRTFAEAVDREKAPRELVEEVLRGDPFSAGFPLPLRETDATVPLLPLRETDATVPLLPLRETDATVPLLPLRETDATVPVLHGGDCLLGRSREEVYFCREMLCRSVQGRRVELWTITDREGMETARDGCVLSDTRLFPLARTGVERRPRRAPGRREVFVSARVHPGETPASHTLAGLIQFLTRPAEEDPRAAALRRMFVFRIVPCLNPDGVARGHYRADTFGKNLNRFYGPRGGGVAVDDEEGDIEATPEPEVAPPDPVVVAGRTFELDACPDRQPSVWAAQVVALAAAFGGWGSIDRPCASSAAGASPATGRLWAYLDMHAHVSKLGCFFYGNHLEGVEDQVENWAFAFAAGMHCPHVDVNQSVFSAQNMSSKDKRDEGRTKEGSGRVGVWKLTGCVRCYTLECNYCTGRTAGGVPPADRDGGRATPPPARFTVPKYEPQHWQHAGRACGVALLEMQGLNPWSRLSKSEWRSLSGLRAGIARKLAADAHYGKAALEFARTTLSRAVGSVSRASSSQSRPVMAPSISRTSSSRSLRAIKPHFVSKAPLSARGTTPEVAPVPVKPVTIWGIDRPAERVPLARASAQSMTTLPSKIPRRVPRPTPPMGGLERIDSESSPQPVVMGVLNRVRSRLR
jgi:hypothetical protein